MFVRMHTGEGRRIVAACDEELLGKTFRENGVRITVHEEFYMGESVDEETFVERMKIATVLNLVGEGVVSVAIREGYVSPDCVIEIDGVKHAQAVLM